MINGNFFINYKNAYDYFGVLVADGSYKGFFSPPNTKEVKFNDWPEENGIEADLSALKFDSRLFQVDFICVDASKVDGFFAELIATGYQLFDLTEFGVSFNLRYVEHKKSKRLKNGESFSITFSEDKPLDGYSYSAPTPVVLPAQSYTLDGTNLAAGYGILVGEGTDDNFRQKASAKENLEVSSMSETGTIYDTGIMKLKTRDAEAILLLKAPAVSVFWQNYQAFLYDLIRPGERVLSGPFGSQACFYKSGKTQRFEKLRGGGIWCEMKMKFTII